MSGPSTMPPTTEPASVRAEAAAWVARLQSPERDAETERAFRRWFDSDAAHASAFNKATEIWQAIGGAAQGLDQRPAFARRRLQTVAAVLAVVVLAGGGAAWGLLRDAVYATKVGEQRTVRLSDGSRVVLNTDTKIAVDYDRGERRVRLVRGEALFDVAKNPDRPFIVAAEGQEVRALGTSFVVRDEGNAIAVTLIEGKVAVTPRKSALKAEAARVVLAPGERVRVSDETAAKVDRPRMETVTAWRSGQILLDNTPLSQAVAEMNRYSPTPLELETERIAGLRVSGIFKSSEIDAFARTVSAQYDLALIQQPDRMLLAEAPQ